MSLFGNKQIQSDEEQLDQLSSHLQAYDFEEGQLAIDVYRSGDNLIVKSTIAGARPEDIDIVLQGDVLTIKGRREMEEYIDSNDYLYRECYWGKFSRTLILPYSVDEEGVDVNLERGVLTIILPKAEKRKEVKIKVIE